MPNNLTKLARTVVGLPVCLAVWPITFIVGALHITVKALSYVCDFCMYGNIRDGTRIDKYDRGAYFWFLLLPYAFLKQVRGW